MFNIKTDQNIRKDVLNNC